MGEQKVINLGVVAAATPPQPPREVLHPDANFRTVTDDLTCARCGYSIKGLAVMAACPECSQIIFLSLGAVLVGGRVQMRAGSTCIACLHDISGLHPLDTCGSCGSPAWHSERPGAARRSGPAAQRRGADQATVGVVGMLMSIIVGVGIGGLGIASGERLGWLLYYASWATFIASVGLAFLGWFRLTAATTSRAGRRVADPARWSRGFAFLAATVLILMVLTVVAQIATIVMLGPLPARMAILNNLLSVLVIAFLLALAGAWVTGALHLRRLLPVEPKSARQSLTAVLILQAAGAVFSLLYAFFPLTTIASLAGLSLIAALLLSISALDTLRKHLHSGMLKSS